jgi:hypothetical protein
MTRTGFHPAMHLLQRLRRLDPPDWMPMPLALLAVAILLYVVVYMRG